MCATANLDKVPSFGVDDCKSSICTTSVRILHNLAEFAEAVNVELFLSLYHVASLQHGKGDCFNNYQVSFQRSTDNYLGYW